MSFQNLAPCLSQVETALKQCLSALSAEHPVSVSALSETIGHCANALKTCTTALLVSLLATCTSPSYAIAPHYQPTNNDSFILVDTVAMSGNNDRQEPRNLLNTVQHHTIVDVFLCLSFASLPFMGELRLAIALIALWWGGSGNKPFIRRIPLAVCLRFSSLPAALHLGKIIKTPLPVEKVQTK